VVDARGVEEGAAAFDAVDLVSLGEQELGEVGAVLSGDSGDEGFLQRLGFSLAGVNYVT
jgi:hypothetical protein